MSKSSWYYTTRHEQAKEERHRDLKEALLQIAKDHPEYGYRRVGPELTARVVKKVNHKLVQKLMKDQELVTLRAVNRPPEGPIRPILLKLGNKMNLYRPLLDKETEGKVIIGIFTMFTTDFTEILYDQGRKKVQLMPLIDHQSKYCPGFALGSTATSEAAAKALTNAGEGVRHLGYQLEGAIVHHDQGSAYISYEWLCQVLICHNMRLSYALRGAKDNPAMESFNGRFKKENRDLFWECQTLEELAVVVGERIKYYNEKRRHS